MKYIFLILMGFCTAMPLMAQQISVEDFARIKKSTLQKQSLPVNKYVATLDLYTSESGFQFLIKGVEISAEEGEGHVTLKMPHRANSLTIKHPKYGQLNWKIPGKGLKKKKRYLASLRIDDPEREFKPDKQWVVFYIHPENAIAYIDSTVQTVRNGTLQMYLPVGEHSCQIISPFYEPYTDTFEMTDSARLEKEIQLKPFYAYLTVRTPFPDAEIRLDGKPIGIHQAETGRIMPGSYRLSIYRDMRCYYDAPIEVANTERIVFDLQQNATASTTRSPLPSTEGASLSNDSPPTTDPDARAPLPLPQPLPLPDATRPALVSILALDDQTEIWINRENKGSGSWEGMLSPGFYAVSTRKDGLESRTSYIWVESGKDTKLNLASPQADYGSISVSCDQVDADVFLNDLPIGRTPCLLNNLPTHRSYVIRVIKGKKTTKKEVQVKGNDIVHVAVKLK